MKRESAPEILYGLHPVAEALAAGRRIFYEIYYLKDKANRRIEQVLDTAAARGIPSRKIAPEQLRSMVKNEAHQGIAARVSPLPEVPLAGLAPCASGDATPCFILAIDHVVDPHNLGALIRTALCAGVTGVVIPRDRSARPTPAVSKTSAGALEHIRLARVINLANTMKNLKKNGIWFIGLDKSGDTSIYDVDLSGNIGLVVGGEKSGIRPLVKRECDFISFIPQSGPVTSLNASVAGGIAIYEAYRQRRMRFER